ncbi:MAG TPA: hypothetical protein VK461_12785, partial [Acidimicrobiales bacterium]|nr:hypothetical protein [Acidimicrobiales bacterium]
MTIGAHALCDQRMRSIEMTIGPRSVAFLLALAFALPAEVVAPPAPANADAHSPVVILYGDSLASEAQDHFVAAVTLGTDAKAIGRSFGGTAICDYFDIMKEDAAKLHPTAVVLEFSGNRFTTCMHHPDGSGMGDGDAYMKYVADVQEAVQIFTSVGTHVYLAGAPVSRPAPGSFQRARALNVMYSWVALVSPSGTVTYVDAGTAVQRGTEYTDELPCLPEEPCPTPNGSI